jgi:hypothetical protein
MTPEQWAAQVMHNIRYAAERHPGDSLELWLTKAFSEAIAEEREACARAAEDALATGGPTAAPRFIRARGQS